MPPKKPVQQKASKAADYKKIDNVEEHMLYRPGMYIGTKTVEAREAKVYDAKTCKIIDSNVSVSLALEQLFRETISNAADNIQRSLEGGYDPKQIEVTVNSKSVNVKNYGKPITTDLNEEGTQHVPEMIFGSMFSSSNYNEERSSIGVNGLGIKAVNIFSDKFVIDLGNKEEKKRYRQTWTNNKKNKTKEIIDEYKGVNYVSVTFFPSFVKYLDDKEFTDDSMALFAKHSIDVAVNYGIPVIFNGIKYHYPKRKDYVNLYFPDMHDEKGVLLKRHSSVYKEEDFTYIDTENKSKREDGSIEVIMVDTPEDGTTISFVNGLYTKNGGKHVDGVLKHVVDGIRDLFDQRSAGKSTDKSLRLAPADVKGNISLFVFCFVKNPQLAGQTKDRLDSPNIKVKPDDKFYTGIMKWRFIERLLILIQAKSEKELKKGDGKKGKVKLRGLLPANLAGSKRSGECTLCIVEGQSAVGYADSMISLTENGADYFGSYPIKGKILNVMNATPLEIADNAEIKGIKIALGLKEGVDYAIDKNFSSLNYGALWIIADSDVDGKHIVALLINFFYCRFPSLLKRKFLNFVRTPIVRAFPVGGGETLKFHTLYDYHKWEKENGKDVAKEDAEEDDEEKEVKEVKVAAKGKKKSKWHLRYYKGLGSSTTEDISDDLEDQFVVLCVFDDKTPVIMREAFDMEQTDIRKVWIQQFKQTKSLMDIREMPISLFIKEELVEFSVANMHRSIPAMADGLKPCQRKILYTALNMKGKKNKKSMKLVSLVGDVMSKTQYVHGDKSLSGTAIGMAQDFTCSGNNLPYLVPDGRFGTRYRGGKNCAAPRYLSTSLRPYITHVFRKEDNPILDIQKEEGEDIEPVFMYPIIPMHLINGGMGIGTGFSSTIPSHSPVHVCRWLLARLDNDEKKPLPEIFPWHRGFKGKIIHTRKENKGEGVIITESTKDGVRTTFRSEGIVDEKDMYTEKIISRGNYVENDGHITVTELPVGKWPIVYREKFLDPLVETGEIEDFEDARLDDEVEFSIHGFQHKPSFTNLKLMRNHSTSNMYLLGTDMMPKLYAETRDILEEFYKFRLDKYEVRKKYLVNKIVEKITILNHKRLYVKACIDKVIIPSELSREKIKNKLIEMKIDPAVMPITKVNDMTTDGYREICDEIAEIEKSLEKEKNTLVKETWKKEINEFLKEYAKHYSPEL